MLEAVQVIHDEKIVHSDLKPANFVLVKGQLKLIDFGIANAIANDTTNIQRDHQASTPFAPQLIVTKDRSLDWHCQLYVPRSYRVTGWNASPESWSSQ
jgi:serine/threonine protein kinase